MYPMAAYCRLSKDDGEKKISESIENQIKLIREFVEKSEDLELAEIYMDDGYSGLSFTNRPGFQRMMEDIYKGKIKGVITKDISRLGREHIETSHYIERVFPALGIRYIAILDGVDSVLHSNEELAQFKTVFNDMYSRDISKKIRGALTTQKKRGLFMSAFAPYGYRKDPEERHHFLVDEEAAKVVQKIFHMYLKGYSQDGIAKKLNEAGILTPSEYKRKVQGLNYFNAQEKAGKKGWSYPTIHMILKNRVYTGAMIQHKSEKISYKVDKYRYIPEEQQYIVEGMHESIISREVFQQVQQMMKRRTRTPGFHREVQKINPYAGLLVCGDCGYHLQRVTSRDGYECGCYHKKGTRFCYSHFIRKELLDMIVKNEIQRQAREALKEQDRQEILREADNRKEATRRKEEADRRLAYLRKELEKVQTYKKKTYENYVDGVLDREEFLFYQSEYEKQAQKVQESILQGEAEKDRYETTLESEENWIEKLVKYDILETVTREIAAEWIDRIVVHGDRSMDIVFRYQSPYSLK